MSASLVDFLAAGDAFRGYAYAYPHKTAYRRLDPPVALEAAWAGENKQGLFLYVHVPFCDKRCGFCNLFTSARPGADLVSRYLAALDREAQAVALALGPAQRLARFALGGGTPTYLSVAELEQVFALLRSHFPSLSQAIPKAVEASPRTITEEKLALFRAHRVTRMSLGVQSFIAEEVQALGRSQSPADARRALRLMAAAGFACVNVDLMYGIPGQTVASWRRSLAETLEYGPQEIYLYPLYVRPLTGLAGRACGPADLRFELYRAARDFLRQREYRQISMRLFRAPEYAAPAEPEYSCQEDGMIGLGPGARSYTAELHYSTEYAVGQAGVQAIIEAYASRKSEAFAQAHHGCRLDSVEQRRRYVLKSLLRADGLDRTAYRRRFGSEALRDLPQLAELVDPGLANLSEDSLRLTARGLEWSDVIGPWLCSPAIRQRMETFALS